MIAYNKEMNLLSEIKRQLGAASGSCMQYTVVDGVGGYFQNVRKIREFSPEKILLEGKSALFSVIGERLSVGKYLGGDLIVNGQIERVERAVLGTVGEKKKG